MRDFGDLSYLVKGNYEKGMRALLRRAHLRPVSVPPPPSLGGAARHYSGGGGEEAGAAVTAFEAREALEVRLRPAPAQAPLHPALGLRAPHPLQSLRAPRCLCREERQVPSVCPGRCCSQWGAKLQCQLA